MISLSLSNVLWAVGLVLYCCGFGLMVGVLLSGGCDDD